MGSRGRTGYVDKFRTEGKGDERVRKEERKRKRGK